MKILVIEDEIKLAEYLKKGLGEAGHNVDIVHNGVDGLHMALEAPLQDVHLSQALRQSSNEWLITMRPHWRMLICD